MSAFLVPKAFVVLLGITLLFAVAWARADSCVNPTAVPASDENWSLENGKVIKPDGPPSAPSVEDLLQDLTGWWSGRSWGEVRLKDTNEGSIGTYSDTFNRKLGSLTLKRRGPRTYTGLWWESDLRRYGSLQLNVAEDGLSIGVTWKGLDSSNRRVARESTWHREVLNWPEDIMITPSGPLSAASLKDLLQEPPIVAIWKTSDHLRSRSTAPNLRIAIWNDGRVLSAQDPTKWGHQLELGRLADDTLSKLKKEILDTDVFDLKGHCYLVPSAPVLCLLVQLDGKKQLLYWDEVEMPNYGINTNPKPHHLAFKKAWKSVNKLVVSAIPEDSVEVLERFEAAPKSWYVKPAIQSE